jgi:DNA-directed RNA polymerase subunit M/transcription elongation factor TFIIS
MGRVATAIVGKRQKTKAGVFVCPSCGSEHWSVSKREDGKWRCSECGNLMAEKEEDLDKLIVEKEVDGYVCPVCEQVVEDTPLNYTGEETINGKMAILCPKCHNFVNGLPLIHHGVRFGDFEPVMSGTDYFHFFHKPCKDKGAGGSCEVYACLIDNTGRVILNLQCSDCKAVDAVKTRPGVGRTFLSPKLRHRVGKHSWDDA